MPTKPHKQIEGSEYEHYVSPRKQRGQEERPLQPPLTPMIDVTFQLLLYFLLTSQFREDEGQIPGSLPHQGGVSAAQVDLKPIRVTLVPRGVYREQVQYNVDQLAPINDAKDLTGVLMAKQKQLGSDEIPVLIKARSDVRWRYVVEVFNAAVNAQFKNISFASSL
jgi:biopolymer transport protein ExbD